MKLFSFVSLAVVACSSVVAHADSFNVSYLGAGVQASSASNYVENFNNATKASDGSYTTNFNNSGITGVYSGKYSIVPAGQYGGAGGSGQYATTGVYSGSGSPYQLQLSKNVNYFGLWFSALDQNNQLSFYNGNTLVYTFTSSQFLNAVGACPASAYCGNPNNGQDSGEQFAFINFYDANGSFNKVVFSELPGYYGDFESDNHTIGNLSSNPGGTPLAATPEPSSLAMLGTGALGLIGAARRRFLKA